MTLSRSIQHQMTATAVFSRAGVTVLTCDSTPPWPASNEIAQRYAIESPRQAFLLYVESGQDVVPGDAVSVTEEDAEVRTLRVAGVSKWRDLVEIAAESIG